MRRITALVLLPLALSGSGVTAPQPMPTLAERYDLRRRAARFNLPGRLDEVSGLAATDDGDLWAHGDERGIVYRIDPEAESVDRGFRVGEGPVRDDLEGIAIVGERFFLASSRGLLYEFREADERATTPVRVTDTGLGDRCEIEGLTYLKDWDSLLLVCKTLAPPSAEIRVHALALGPGAIPHDPIRVPFRDLVPFGLERGVHPSGIDVDPATGTLVLTAAREEALVEIDLQGRVRSVVRLARRRHPQPEGIAFGTDGRLYVADEAQGNKARLTAYERAPGVGR